MQIKINLKTIPSLPGVYIMKDQNQKVIYVGKAKNLKNRVSSYFYKSAKDNKTQLLIKDIYKLDYIITNTELEALILECNIIKKKKPKYNIDLKDNKTYPFIKITTNESFPRVFKTRYFKRDGNKYFGPYPSISLIHQHIDLIHRLFPIRTCTQVLPNKKDNKPCLNYFIERCKGVCSGELSVKEYRKYIDEIVLFLSGKYSKLISRLTKQMNKAANELRYELASVIKLRIEAVRSINERQIVYSTNPCNIDVIGFFEGEKAISFSIMLIREGKLLGKRIFVIKENNFLERSMLFEEVLKKYYLDDNEIPDEIVLPIDIEDKNLLESYFTRLKKKKLKITVPKIGLKKEWTFLACQNAKFGFLEEQKITQKELALIELKKVLNLPSEPRYIEGFDVANTMGKDSVIAMVYFKDGVAYKKSYRHFKVKSVDKPNDVAMIKEGIARRYQKLLNNSSPLPDLILIDGGKGQVNGTKKVLDSLGLSITVIGLAKKDEDIVFPNKKDILKLDKTSIALRLLQQIRDEAHRFGNVLHKKLRKKRMFKSSFDNIRGIGKIRKEALLMHFKTVSDIKNASVEELCKVDKMDKVSAKRVFDYFR